MNVLIYMQLRVSHRKVEKGGKGIVFRMKMKTGKFEYLHKYNSSKQLKKLKDIFQIQQLCFAFAVYLVILNG